MVERLAARSFIRCIEPLVSVASCPPVGAPAVATPQATDLWSPQGPVQTLDLAD